MHFRIFTSILVFYYFFVGIFLFISVVYVFYSNLSNASENILYKLYWKLNQDVAFGFHCFVIEMSHTHTNTHISIEMSSNIAVQQKKKTM